MHDLWIFPAPRASRWFARLDWYLNWQMSKGLSYPGLHLPDDIARVADRHGLNVEPVAPLGGDLLVLPGSLVPAKKCLVIDDGDRPLAAWFAQVAERADQLRARTLRVFLPAGRTREDAAAAWAGIKPGFEVTFDQDLETPR